MKLLVFKDVTERRKASPDRRKIAEKSRENCSGKRGDLSEDIKTAHHARNCGNEFSFCMPRRTKSENLLFDSKIERTARRNNNRRRRENRKKEARESSLSSNAFSSSDQEDKKMEGNGENEQRRPYWMMSGWKYTTKRMENEEACTANEWGRVDMIVLETL
ncbi:hypothetical protein LR48_Vigan97s002300 [Vigna angularis]|uniref:Uncharacterized protein n=1 Tax=Phaseolus angularis TaxID=3914 RepID=A0A0L9T418_PHAAN|nr:hypothetical protein LR48_Vigan97s002300 [Vigna angularis]